ncbi:MAG: heme ABC transporter ATP-binding protein [Gemmatimonadales bacterium]
MLELRNASWEAGGRRIVDDVSTTFVAGGFHVIIGPNGAGKTSLLRLATGSLTPTSGEVRFARRPIGEYGTIGLARRRAVLSQHVELAFPLEVEDVVMMGRYPHFARAPHAEDRRIVSEALALVEMLPQRKQWYPTLSGGEQQKVQLARVLAQIWDDAEGAVATRALFLDEPTASLDIHYQIHLLDVARDLAARGCTVVAILHDLNTALEYGTHFLVLEQGRVALQCEAASDIPQELIERVFRVHARRVAEPGQRGRVWRFSK